VLNCGDLHCSYISELGVLHACGRAIMRQNNTLLVHGKQLMLHLYELIVIELKFMLSLSRDLFVDLAGFD